MRVIAGIARGRRLAAPKGTATRPTSDRAREGLFATVTAIRGPLPGARVLDLFAGLGSDRPGGAVPRRRAGGVRRV